jgi:hypothetical protein
MHAILGFAASHLELLTGVDLKTTAMHHRVQAIKGSAAALSQTARSRDDGDALLASCYLLSYQSTYIKEGIPEFLHFIRGCSLVWQQFLSEKVPLTFSLTEESAGEFMKQRLVALPDIDSELLGDAVRSLSELRPILSKPVHSMFHGLFEGCINAVKTSSIFGEHCRCYSEYLSDSLGYFKCIELYKAISSLDTVSFKDLVDPANIVSQILIAYLLTIQLIMLPIMAREWQGRTRTTPVRTILEWILSISSSIPTHMRQYVEWPKAIADAVHDELSGKLPTASKRPVLRKNEGLSLDIV